MKILSSFICLSLGLALLAGCGEKAEEIREVKEVEQPVIEDTTKPESMAGENVFEQLFKDGGDIVDSPGEPVVIQGENVFEQLFKDTQETTPKRPSFPTIPTADESDSDLNEDVQQTPPDSLPTGENVFEQLFK